MKFVFALILLLNFSFFAKCFSQEATLSAKSGNILNLLEANSKKVNTIKGGFSQTKLIASLGIQVQSTGLFYYKKVNRKIRWEYTQPTKFTAIFNNGAFGILNQDNSASLITKQGELFAELNTVIISSLEGSLSRLENFKLSVYELDGGYLISLVPEDMNSISKLLSKVDIHFSASDYTVSKIELFELNSDITSISFLTLLINPSISDSLFKIQ